MDWAIPSSICKTGVEVFSFLSGIDSFQKFGLGGGCCHRALIFGAIGNDGTIESGEPASNGTMCLEAGGMCIVDVEGELERGEGPDVFVKGEDTIFDGNGGDTKLLGRAPVDKTTRFRLSGVFEEDI